MSGPNGVSKARLESGLDVRFLHRALGRLFGCRMGRCCVTRFIRLRGFVLPTAKRIINSYDSGARYLSNPVLIVTLVGEILGRWVSLVDVTRGG